MRGIVWFFFSIFLFHCGSQRQACELDAQIYLDKGFSYESCERAEMFFVLANHSSSKNPESLSQKSFDISLLFCLRYIQAEQNCKDISTYFPALK